MTENSCGSRQEQICSSCFTYGKAVFFTVLVFLVGISFFGGRMAWEYGYPMVPAAKQAQYAAGSLHAVMLGALSFLPMGGLMGLGVGLFGVGPLTVLYDFIRQK